mgnify:CR=1 FL=1
MINQFKIGGVTWKVKQSDRIDEGNALGVTLHKESTIEIDVNVCPQLAEQTLYHELTHVILDTIGEHKLSGNEKFVHAFSTLLHQFEVTKK